MTGLEVAALILFAMVWFAVLFSGVTDLLTSNSRSVPITNDDDIYWYNSAYDTWSLLGSSFIFAVAVFLIHYFKAKGIASGSVWTIAILDLVFGAGSLMCLILFFIRFDSSRPIIVGPNGIAKLSPFRTHGYDFLDWHRVSKIERREFYTYAYWWTPCVLFEVYGDGKTITFREEIDDLPQLVRAINVYVQKLNIPTYLVRESEGDSRTALLEL